MASLNEYDILVEFMPHDEYKLTVQYRGKEYTIGHYRSKAVAHRMANNLHNLLVHLETQTVAIFEEHTGIDLGYARRVKYDGKDVAEFHRDILG